MANCTNQDDYDCLLGLKISYQTKLENNANSIAKEFYQIADDNSGFSSVEKISALIDKKINANNIVAILDAYENPEIRHDDSSMIDTITSETGASAAKQRKALTKIINVLCEAAKNAGVSESDITNAKNSFVTSMEKELGAHFRRTNPKDMEKAIDFLKGAILAKQNEVANVDEDSAMQAIAQNYQSQNAQANEDFETARKEEGWTAKTGDWVCGLFGCNTEDELRAKLGDNAQKVEKLIAAANSGNKEEFKKVYKELFGIEFDANKIAASEEYQEKYFTAVSMSETNKAIDEILNQNLDYQGTVNALKEKLKYDDETINQIMAQYNQPMETEAEKLALLKQFMTSTKENCAQKLKYLTQGESLEQMANKAELLAKAAFGTNDIAKDVTQFNENMVMTEMMTDAAFEIAGTIALQFVPGLGQAAAVKLAASAAKWGIKGAKVLKYTQRGMQIGRQMLNAGVATAAVEFSSGKDMETAVKKIVMNMSFAGVGATSSMIAPKLVQAFGIESQLATEIAEELINAAGSYGVCTAAGDEYGSTDFWTDMATGLIMSRLAHVKGGKPKQNKTIVDFTNSQLSIEDLTTQLNQSKIKYTTQTTPDGRILVKINTPYFPVQGKFDCFEFDTQGNCVRYGKDLRSDDIKAAFSDFDDISAQTHSHNSGILYSDPTGVGNLLQNADARINAVNNYTTWRNDLNIVQATRISEFKNTFGNITDNLNTDEINNIIKYAEKEMGENFETLLELFPDDLLDTYIKPAVKVKQNGYASFIQESMLFNGFELSLTEIYELKQLISIGDNSGIINVLRKNNPELLDKLGGDLYLSTDSTSTYLRNLNENLDKVLESNVLKTLNNNSQQNLGIINGVEKNIIIGDNVKLNPVNTRKSKDFNFNDLLESNLITTEALNILTDLNISLKENLSSSFPIPGKETIKVSLSTKEILSKIENYGYNSLTSHEIHVLTDELTNLYKTNDVFAKELKKRLQNQAKNIYGYVDALQSRFSPVFKKFKKVKISANEHFAMRMIDRNLVTTINNKTFKIVNCEEIVETICKELEEKCSTLKLGQQNLLINTLGGNGITIKINKKSANEIVIETIIS